MHPAAEQMHRHPAGEYTPRPLPLMGLPMCASALPNVQNSKFVPPCAPFRGTPPTLACVPITAPPVMFVRLRSVLESDHVERRRALGHPIGAQQRPACFLEAFTAPPQIGRAVQQECRDRSRMPSSA
eukprot:TRINITY_DN2317_c0_g2_i3.p1 TRINITY_DN2317_c0_g2~~TRINITY_DN2317_c0_g2_i3.p1  ORF type:complete len:127 (+),score=8.56 TRINITY_DN2317_c0_g2_i3:409-789(+)